MKGEISQYVALTCHGNAFLNGYELEPFSDNSSTCQCCERINFKIIKKSLLVLSREKEIAKTPDEWFYYLKSSAAQGVRLSSYSNDRPSFPDRYAQAFVNDGRTWLMEVILPKNQSEYWVSQWNVGNRESPERRIWNVKYVRVKQGTTPRLEAMDLTSVIGEMTKRLREIHVFAKKQGIAAQVFEEALDTINSKGKNLYGYHKDLAPKGLLSEQATTILDACHIARIFGGMGSWNDFTFDGDIQKEYDKVSENLFLIVNKAIAAGTNASFYR